jgi:hypothetical protein
MSKLRLVPIKVGDTKKIGEKEYELDGGGGLVMQVAVPFRKAYNKDGLLATKAKLQAQLVEVDSLLAKLAELEDAS